MIGPQVSKSTAYNIPSQGDQLVPSQKGDDVTVVKITKFDNANSLPPKFSNSNAVFGGKKLYDVPSSSSITSSFYSSSVEELSKINFPPSKLPASKPTQ